MMKKLLSVFTVLALLTGNLAVPALADELSQEQTISVASAIASIRQTLDEIDTNRTDAALVDAKLEELMMQLLDLSGAVESEGGTASAEAAEVLSQVETVAGQFDSENAEVVKLTVSVIKEVWQEA